LIERAHDAGDEAVHGLVAHVQSHGVVHRDLTGKG
jgi:hypothetical protein